MSDDKTPKKDGLSGLLQNLTVTQAATTHIQTHEFESSRFNPSTGKTTAEPSILIVNPDDSSPVAGLLVTVNGIAANGRDFGFSIHAMGDARALQTHFRQKGILFIDDIIRSGKTQEYALTQGNTPAEAVSLDVCKRPDRQDDIINAMTETKMDVSPEAIDLLCLLDTQHFETEILVAQKSKSHAHSRFSNTTLENLVNEETRYLLQDMHDTRPLSGDPATNLAMIEHIARFLQENYKGVPLKLKINTANNQTIDFTPDNDMPTAG